MLFLSLLIKMHALKAYGVTAVMCNCLATVELAFLAYSLAVRIFIVKGDKTV